MTGKGHRISTFAFVLGATSSPLAAAMSFMGSTFPDSSEYMFFGKRRNRYHRRYTHWFVIWLALAYVCFSRSGWIVPRLSSLIDGRNAHYDVWSCAGFWFMGCVLHILEDAFCGTVPLLRPWKRDVGMHIFHMSKKIGEMSTGEINFVLCCAGISFIAYIIRTFTFESFFAFLANIWRSI
ncbi:MAG: metal-dependent hydrolase [Synergistaceae bacterium]|nr:metal-dependent hydrolase [Synergistaceae bacterium]MBR0249750.1 metal-dependent hydrolase [Synergistaceae bacterium]